MAVSTADRFWSKVDKSSDCWIWTAGKRYGYGTFRLSTARRQMAHRFAWELHHGAIPSGLLACHHCDNPSCVNPAHLFLGTPAANVQDMMAKGRDCHPIGDRNRAKTHCPRGHGYTEENTYYIKTSRHCKACKREKIRERRAALRAAA